jgi:hypothetical protein
MAMLVYQRVRKMKNLWVKQCHVYHPWLGMVTIPRVKGGWLGGGANGIVLPTSSRGCNIIPYSKSENFECDLHLALHGIMMVIHRIRWRKWAIMGNLSWTNPGIAYQLVSGATLPFKLGDFKQLITKNPKLNRGWLQELTKMKSEWVRCGSSTLKWMGFCSTCFNQQEGVARREKVLPYHVQWDFN